MCAMPSGTQMATLASGSTGATHPRSASWSKLQQGGESKRRQGLAVVGGGVSRLYPVEH
jgi:hypothetical protein